MLSSPVASCALVIALEWPFLALVLMACRPACSHCPSRFANRNKAGSVQRLLCDAWLCFLISPYQTARKLRFAKISLQNSWREPRVDVSMMPDIRKASRSVWPLSGELFLVSSCSSPVASGCIFLKSIFAFSLVRQAAVWHLRLGANSVCAVGWLPSRIGWRKPPLIGAHERPRHSSDSENW